MDWWWYFSNWTCESLFLTTMECESETSWFLVLHFTTLPWWLLVFSYDNFSYLSLLERDSWWYCSYWHVRILHFACTGMWTREFWISSSALYHCAIKNLVFSYENSRYLTLLERGWWWYHCNWTCESFFHFACTGMWTRDLKIYSPALYHCGMVMCGFVIC